MKRKLPVIALAFVFLTSCGQVKDNKISDKQIIDNSIIEKPDMDSNVSKVSGWINKIDGFYQTTFGCYVDHPDDLYFSEPQMAYSLTEKDGKWTAEPAGYEYYIIDKADNSLEGWIKDIGEKSMNGGMPEASQIELFASEKAFIVAYDKNHYPIFITDGQVYFSEGETPDISNIEFPETEPLKPVYKLDIEE